LGQAEIECREGWSDLIRIACDALSNERFKGITIFQIKEKFGQLRINLKTLADIMVYDNGMTSSEVWNIIESIERLSRYFCEFCGNVRGVTTGTIPTGTQYGWIKTLCEKCRKEANANRISRMGDS